MSKIHKFSYVNAGIWYRPIIPILIKCNKVEFRYMALLDSGADFNIFHGEIAKILKIDLEKISGKQKPVIFGGIKEGASGKGYFYSLDLGIDDYLFSSTAVFSNDISNNGYGILGQQGFFNNFKVNFDYGFKNIEIIEK